MHSFTPVFIGTGYQLTGALQFSDEIGSARHGTIVFVNGIRGVTLLCYDTHEYSSGMWRHGARDNHNKVHLTKLHFTLLHCNLSSFHV